VAQLSHGTSQRVTRIYTTEHARAADISGPEQNMRRFSSWVSKEYGPRFAELIHNSGCSIKDGRGRSPAADFWTLPVRQQHRNHVYLAVYDTRHQLVRVDRF